jgi:mannosyl-oligosaccharide alpha-1,2-mannosidase
MMLSKVILAPLLAALPWTAIAVPHGPQLNKKQSYGHGSSASQRAAAVKEAFTHAWDGYYKYAFPHDELHPVSNTYSDSRYVYVLQETRLCPC